MKRFIWAAIAAVFCLVSCEKDSVNKLIGTWEASEMTLEIEGFEMNMDIQEMSGGSIEMTFKRDGTVTMTERMDGESYSDTYDYTYNDSILTLIDDDESISIPATVSGDKLTMKITPEMMEEEDIQGNMKIIWTRK